MSEIKAYMFASYDMSVSPSRLPGANTRKQIWVGSGIFLFENS